MTNLLNAHVTTGGTAVVHQDDDVTILADIERVSDVSDAQAIEILGEVDFEDGVIVSLTQRGFTPKITETTIVGMRVFVPGPIGFAAAVKSASEAISSSGVLIHEGFAIETSELEFEEPALAI